MTTITIKSARAAKNYLTTMNSLFAGDHGNTHAGAIQRDAQAELESYIGFAHSSHPHGCSCPPCWAMGGIYGR